MATQITIKKSAQPVITCDLGGTKLAVAVMDHSYRIITNKLSTVAGLPYGKQIDLLVHNVKALIAAHPEVQAVGVAVAGDVASKEGLVSYRSVDKNDGVANFEYTTVHLVKRLKRATGLPVFLENDGNAAAVAEWRAGAALGKENVVSLTFGTFLGSGVIIKNRLIQRRQSGLLVGGMLVCDDSEKVMPLGFFASGIGLTRAAEQLIAKNPHSQLKKLVHHASIDGAGLLRLALAGDNDALAVYKKMGFWAGMAVTSAINIFQPQIVVLGGGVMAAHEFIMPEIQRVATQHSEPGLAREAQIVLAKNGKNACLVGAAELAFRQGIL